MTLATRIAVLKQGEVQQIGSPDEIYNSPANTFVADFMGSPAMNRVHGQLVNSNDLVEFRFENQSLTVESPSEALRSLAQAESMVEFGIRAEDISANESASNSTLPGNSLPLTVDIIEPTGSDTFVTTNDGSASYTARIANNVTAIAGEKMSLHFDMSKAHFFNSETGQRIS